MPKLSAGILPYRISGEDGQLELFLVHPGGPLWAKKDEGAWSIVKGEYQHPEDPAEVAEREFAEEVGMPAPPGKRVDLGELSQPSGKRIHVWAVEATDFAVREVKSNEFELEWPPKSGVTQSFPEVDRASWFPARVARRKLVKGQVAFIDSLLALVRASVNATVTEGDGSEGNGRDRDQSSFL